MSRLDQTFFMIHVDGAKAPTARHKTYERAILEAERLAKQEGKAVFVLRALTMVTSDTCFEHYRLKSDDDFADLIQRSLDESL